MLVGVLTTFKATSSNETYINPNEQYLVAEHKPVWQNEIPIECQCVYYIKQFTKDKFSGNAKDWQRYINQDFPSIGAIIVLDTEPLGHIGMVTSLDISYMEFESQNWSKTCLIEKTKLLRSDPKILGYITF